MATTFSYDEVFNSFLGMVSDYEFLSMSGSDANELMTEYLHKSISKPYTRRLFTSITLKDEIQQVTFEMKYVVDESADLDFVINILAIGMAIEWALPQVRSKANMQQFYGGKEQNFYSQANHISELRGLLDDLKVEQQKLIKDRGFFNNPYLDKT